MDAVALPLSNFWDGGYALYNNGGFQPLRTGQFRPRLRPAARNLLSRAWNDSGQSMDFRRTRRTGHLQAGLPANFSETRAGSGSGWTSAHMTYGRHRFRGPSKASGTETGNAAPSAPPLQGARRRQRSVVSLLVGGVLVLWLLLFLSGHY